MRRQKPNWKILSTMKTDTESNEYNNFKELIDESKADLSGYIEKRLEFFKLTAYEKTANMFSRILYSSVIIAFALILFFLFLLTTGLYIGKALQNYPAGFGILILFILLLMVIVILCRKPLKRLLIDITLKAINKIENDED